MEKKRTEFRNYLESAGAIDNLTKALIKLYEQKSKPQDATKFLRKEMCETCHDEEDYEILAADLNEANKKICQLERELARLKGSIRRSPSEIEIALTKGFDELSASASSDESMLKKLLTKEILDASKELKTSFKGTLLDCIQSGLELLDSSIGIYACDPDAYTVFADLFDPLIEQLHGFKKEDKHPDLNWNESCKLPEFEGDYVKSIEISCIRNVEGFPFAAIMTIDQYEEILKKLANVTRCLCSGGLKGKLYPIEGMSDETRKSLIDSNMMLKSDNTQLKAANAMRFWPSGRAIYENEAKTFYIWCNYEDHFKFIVKECNGNLSKISSDTLK